LPFTVDNSGGTARLVLEGDSTISSAAELKKALLELLEGHSSLQVDIERTTEVDTAVLQLLFSACKTVTAMGKTFELVGKSDAFAEALERTGLSPEVLNIRWDTEVADA
jgi:anti-anti-sigma factor